MEVEISAIDLSHQPHSPFALVPTGKSVTAEPTAYALPINLPSVTNRNQIQRTLFEIEPIAGHANTANPECGTLINANLR